MANSKNSESFLKWLSILFFALYFLTSFCQIFIFSESFSVSWLRQIDDPVYHEDLRRVHESLMNGSLVELLKLNNNGYGWLFWIINSVIAFPAYLLFNNGIDVPLVISGRFVCWLFSLGSAIVIYNISKIFSDKITTQIAFVFTYLLFPHIGFWTTRFSSDVPSYFFSTLAFYLSVKYSKHNYITTAFVAISLAAAVAIKLTTMLIVPIITIWMLNNYWKTYNIVDFLKITLYFVVIGLFFFFLFLSPGFYLYPINDEYFNYTINTIKTYASLNDDVGDSNIGLINIFRNSIGIEYLALPTSVIFIASLLIPVRCEDGRNRFNIIFPLAGLTLIISYLMLAITVKKGISYIAVYFHSISFLFCFAYVSVENILKKYKQIGVLVFFFLFLIFNINAFYQKFLAYYNFRYSKNVEMLFAANDDIRKIVSAFPINHGERKTISLVDYRAIFPYTTLDYGYKSIVLLDDFNVRKSWSPTGFDYIVISKFNPALADLSTIAKNYKDADSVTINKITQSKIEIQKLIEIGEVDQYKYSLIYDANSVLVFKRMDFSGK